MNRHRFPSLLAAAAMCGALCLPLSAQAGTFTEVRPASLKADGVKYWRKKASEALLGSVGFKKSPAAGKNYFQHVRNAPNGVFKVKVGSPIAITTSKKTELGVSATAGNGAASGSASGSVSGEYKGSITAFKMSINYDGAGSLRREGNKHHAWLEAVKAQGNKARIISAVWIMVKGSENQSSCMEGSLEVEEGSGTAGVGVSASTCTSSSWSIAPGSVIAYEMSKVKEWSNTEIVKNPTCPSGYPTYEKRSSAVTPKDRCKKTTTTSSGVRCKLGVADKRANWYVSAKSGRDTCKSKKGKKDKSVECVQNGHAYKAQAGKDKCEKNNYTYRDPNCMPGYKYNNKSSSGGGHDKCELRGIVRLNPDSMDGF